MRFYKNLCTHILYNNDHVYHDYEFIAHSISNINKKILILLKHREYFGRLLKN